MTNQIQIKIPDIGGATQVDVIELMVKAGDEIEENAPLITLESDKASMEIPSPQSGKIVKMLVKIGDKVSEGDAILTLEPKEQSTDSKPSPSAQPEAQKPEAETKKKEPTTEETESSASSTSSSQNVHTSNESPPNKNEVNPPPQAPSQTQMASESSENLIFAGPGVRRMARELGVNLTQVKGQGRKGRIAKEDLVNFVKTSLENHSQKDQGLTLPKAPKIDFSKFGPIETKPLNKIKRLTASNLHRSWLNIPHVTQFDEADITDLEAFRQAEVQSGKHSDYKLTMLAFVTKVVYLGLKKYPQFNASLDETGENLIYKQYYNIGIAVETPSGLVVPVIKNVDKLSVTELAKEMARLSKQAREKGLSLADMSGAGFTISSLGGIGGTAFTPIVNGPEVAILGLSRSQIKPLFIGEEFKPRLMLPLSLSYDHRVIDGAEAARFTRFVADLLTDIKKALL